MNPAPPVTRTRMGLELCQTGPPRVERSRGNAARGPECGHEVLPRAAKAPAETAADAKRRRFDAELRHELAAVERDGHVGETEELPRDWKQTLVKGLFGGKDEAGRDRRVELGVRGKRFGFTRTADAPHDVRAERRREL